MNLEQKKFKEVIKKRKKRIARIKRHVKKKVPKYGWVEVPKLSDPQRPWYKRLLKF